MKNLVRWAVIAAAVCGAAYSIQAADETTSSTDASEPASAAANDIPAQLKAIREKIVAKLNARQRSAEALAPELAEVDAILAAHQGEKSEEVAQVLYFKASIHGGLLKEEEKAQALLAQLLAEHPGTAAAKAAEDTVAAIEKQKQARLTNAGLQVGAVFPDFAVQDLAGQPLSLAKFRGKVVLVDFWATWCGPCIGELPNVLAAYQKYHDSGFEIIGVSLDKDEQALKSFIAEKNMPWPQFFDGQGWRNQLAQQYGITSIPATYLLDREGRIVATKLRGRALEAELEKLLGAK